MNPMIDLSQPFQIGDRSGAPLGTYLPEEKLNELQRERESLRHEVESLRRQLAELEQARAELAAARADREMYRRALLAMFAKEEVIITPEEIAEADKDGITLDRFLAELEAEAGL